MRQVLWAGGLLLLLVQGCKPSATRSPEAPKEAYQQSSMDIENEKYLSAVHLPVEVPLAEIEQQINKQLTGLLYEDNSYEDDNQDNFKAKVWKISPIKVQALDSTFLFEVPIKIWASAGYKISPLGYTLSGYKDTEFSMRMRFVSKIGVTQNWKLNSRTYLDSYDWITEPSIKVAGVTISIKGMVSRLLNRNAPQITQAIDKEVAEAFDLKAYAQQAWELARQPVQLSDKYHTWLVIVPTELWATPLLARDKKLRTTLGVRGYTQTITSVEKPTLKPSKPLPNLILTDKVPSEFQLGLISQVTYQEAARLAEENFVGETFSFSNGKYKIQVTSIEMFGQNDKLVIKAGLSGSLNGFVYLKGTPTYNPTTGLLTLQDLDYDLATKNVLIQSANWLFQGKFAKIIERQMAFPIGEQIREAKQTVETVLKNHQVQKGIYLRGKVASIEPDKVYLTPEQLYSVVFVKGQLNLVIEKLY